MHWIHDCENRIDRVERSLQQKIIKRVNYTREYHFTKYENAQSDCKNESWIVWKKKNVNILSETSFEKRV